MIAILDFGSQYGQLIARRVREHNVYSRICRADTSAAELAQMPLKGIILSGGPASVYAPGAPRCDEKIFDLDVPILGICYGMQLGGQILGAEITAPSAVSTAGPPFARSIGATCSPTCPKKPSSGPVTAIRSQNWAGTSRRWARRRPAPTPPCDTPKSSSTVSSSIRRSATHPRATSS
jgi:hypothetical protein